MNFTSINYYKVIIVLFLLLLAFFSATKLFDNYGEKYTDEGFQRSLAAFAIAKGINGAVSVAQGTEFSFEPVGIGLTLTPGQILDPINDLIERFSWIMLLCTTSLGIQSILIIIFSSFYFSIAVTLTLLLVILFIWKDQAASVELKNILFRIAAFLIILRFFIPIMAISSDGLYKVFLETQYIESKSQLENTDKAITKLTKASSEIKNESEDESWLDSISNNFNATVESFNVEQRVEQLTIEAENITNHIIDLIVVFILQTILFPLMFIWLSVKLIKANFTFNFVK